MAGPSLTGTDAMTIYTVLAPQRATGDTLPPDPMRYVFVKEGFAWPALFFGVVWLIFRRMWLVLVGFVALIIVARVIEAGLGGDLPGIFLVLAQFLLALEGNELRRWTLQRNGYRIVDVVEARNLGEAEIHFFARLEGESASADTGAPPAATALVPAAPPPAPITRPPPGPAASGETEVVGLFPAPRGPGLPGAWS